MNSLTSVVMVDPTGKESVCAKLVVDDLNDPFILAGVTSIGTEYTISFWIMSETSGNIQLADKTFNSPTTWTRHIHTLTATDDDLFINFSKTGTYYIYHLQLEQGNRATDWAPAPEDVEEATSNAQATANDAKRTADDTAEQVESSIEMLRDQIRMMIVDENGETMMTQNGEGWTFDFKSHIGNVQKAFSEAMTDLEGRYGSTEAALAALRSEFNDMNNYVKISEYNDNGTVKPCIELGGNIIQNEESTFCKLLITNTSVVFFGGVNRGTEITNDGLTTDNATLRGEFRQHNPNADSEAGSFVWAMRNNGNYGLTWKELVN